MSELSESERPVVSAPVCRAALIDAAGKAIADTYNGAESISTMHAILAVGAVLPLVADAIEAMPLSLSTASGIYSMSPSLVADAAARLVRSFAGEQS